MRTALPTDAWDPTCSANGLAGMRSPWMDPHSRTAPFATVRWGRSVHRLSVDRFHAPRPTHLPLQATPPLPVSPPRRISVAAARTNTRRERPGPNPEPPPPPPLHPMAAVQRLLRAAAASGGSATATARRRMTSLAPSAEAGFPFAAEERARRRPVAERNVQWVFLGCPGVGKGTYASRLSRLLGVPHIATGDLVRDELASTGPLATKLAEIVNQGKLVSDEIIFNLLSKRLKKGEDKGESGFILDGFPRTVKQAEILDGVTDTDMVVNLKLREDVLVEKCLGRRICSQCGKNFNLACIDVKGENGLPAIYMAPLLPPNNCMSKLITRADDTEEVVRNRLRIYNDMSQPVEGFYREQGKLLEFDLPGGIPESWPKLLQVLNLEDQEELKLAAA